MASLVIGDHVTILVMSYAMFVNSKFCYKKSISNHHLVIFRVQFHAQRFQELMCYILYVFCSVVLPFYGHFYFYWQYILFMMIFSYFLPLRSEDPYGHQNNFDHTIYFLLHKSSFLLKWIVRQISSLWPHIATWYMRRSHHLENIPFKYSIDMRRFTQHRISGGCLLDFVACYAEPF